MDKVKLEFKIPKTKKIEYNGVEIEVYPFLEVGAQSVLIEKYLEDYFGEPVEGEIIKGYAKAEYNLLNYLFQVATNIDTSDLDSNLYSDENLIMGVLGSIVNYSFFRGMLEQAVQDKKEEIRLEASLGKVLSALIEKGYDVLDKFSEIKPEEIEKLQKTGIDLAKKLEESSIIGKPAVKKPRQKKA